MLNKKMSLKDSRKIWAEAMRDESQYFLQRWRTRDPGNITEIQRLKNCVEYYSSLSKDWHGTKLC